VKAWPYSYQAEQIFTLDDSSLEIMLTLTNQDQRAMPAGFGLYPFFSRRPRSCGRI
jgi:aldose 1-epimerase